MSDNWNLLAKLLGTPGPPEPRKSAKPKETAQLAPNPNDDQADDQADGQAAADSPESDSQESATRAMPPVAEAVSDVSGDASSNEQDLSGEQVLQALTAETTSTQLPGFGVAPSDPMMEELTAGAPPMADEPIAEQLLERDSKLSESDRLFAGQSTHTKAGENEASNEAEDGEADDNADSGNEAETGVWSELAGELGIESTDEPPPHRAPMPIKPARRESSSERPKRSASPFGDGLGLDLGPDPEPVAESVEETSVAEDRKRPERQSPRRRTRKTEESSASTDLAAETPEPMIDPLSFRSFADFDAETDDDSGDTPAEESHAADASVSSRREERGERSRSRPRRDRDQRDESDGETRSESRGGRSRPERNQEPAADKGSADRSPRGREEETDDGPKKRRRRGRRGQRQRMEEGSPGLETESVDAAIEDIELKGDLSTESDSDGENEPRGRGRRRRGSRSGREKVQREDSVVLGDDDDENAEDDDFGAGLVSDDDGSEDEESTTKRRRRGRRGRGGRRPRSGGDDDGSDSDTAPSRPRSFDPDDEDLEEDAIPASAFDDDHEDDEEVEVIRRGRRRRGRRGGRGRSARDGESTARSDQDENARNVDDDEQPSRPRRGRQRPVESDLDPADSELRPKKVVPTWQEVVNLLVDNNLENHKKAPKGRPRGRRR